MDMAAMLAAMGGGNNNFASGVAMGAALSNNDGYGRGRGYGYGGDWECTQSQANMSLMQSIGAVDKAVAVSTAAMEASQALQSSTIQAQLSGVAAALTGTVNGVKDTVNAMSMVLAQQIAGVDKSVIESRYEVMKDITADGDKTRALITSNYQDTLNRQLTEANAALIELRGDNRAARYARDNEVNVTQTVNQAQQQQQQQSQFDRLYHMLADASQSIRATNQAINFGSGTLTANPTNNNTNNRAG
jgi:hypothetical protein